MHRDPAPRAELQRRQPVLREEVPPARKQRRVECALRRPLHQALDLLGHALVRHAVAVHAEPDLRDCAWGINAQSEDSPRHSRVSACASLRPRPASLEARQPCRPRLVATPQQSALLVHHVGSPSAMPPSPNASATSSAKCGSPRRLLELSFGSWIRSVVTRGTPRRASEAARERRAPAAE
mmetsp:Transcript_33220/g.99136  ORF Transcript_33220/g.99136 Transcript_33220/m.99136 type:complete len:181 (+) Transcript_33220:390-932(+)